MWFLLSCARHVKCSVLTRKFCAFLQRTACNWLYVLTCHAVSLHGVFPIHVYFICLKNFPLGLHCFARSGGSKKNQLLTVHLVPTSVFWRENFPPFGDEWRATSWKYRVISLIKWLPSLTLPKEAIFFALIFKQIFILHIPENGNFYPRTRCLAVLKMLVNINFELKFFVMNW